MGLTKTLVQGSAAILLVVGLTLNPQSSYAITEDNSGRGHVGGFMIHLGQFLVVGLT